MIRTFFAVCFTVLATTSAAFAQSAAGSMQEMTSMSSSTSQMPGDDADKALMAGMAQMDQDMAKAATTGNADQDFVAMMIPHHVGAISMAEAELRYGHDPYLRHLAQQIVAAQNQEITEMKTWQKEHPAP